MINIKKNNFYLFEILDNFIANYLKKNKILSNKNGNNILLLCKYLEKKIEVFPRKIFYAKEFSVPFYLKDTISLIEKDIIQGNDLTKYMSKKIQDPNYNDLLYNDWGIHHFHLGKDIKGKFVSRTKFLLYFHITPHCVYFLKILPHNRWENIEFLNIINRNWPHIIDKNTMPDLKAAEKIQTVEAIKTLRKSHVVTLYTLEDGRAIFPLNFAYSSDGSSIKAVRLSHDINNFLVKYEKDLIENDNTLNFCNMLFIFYIKNNKLFFNDIKNNKTFYF